VQGGGVALNNVRADEARKPISASEFIDGQVLVLRKGAKHYHLIRLM
jgi:tyrosyl-tRNA synthetase